MHGRRISFTARKGVSGKETSVGRAIQSYQTSQLSGSICWSFLLLEKMEMLKTDAKACFVLPTLFLSGIHEIMSILCH